MRIQNYLRLEMHRGYIKLWRKLMDSDMYESLTSVQRDVMTVCLFLANHKEKEWEWKGEVHKCKAGEFKTSLASIKKVCAKDVSIKMIRTALKKLEKWGFLASKGAKEGRIITVIKWEAYQGNYNEGGKATGMIGAKVGQSEGKIGATNKNVKKDKNVKKEDIVTSNGCFSVKDLSEGWNLICGKHGLPKIILPISKARVIKAKLRIKEKPNEDYWQEVFERMTDAPFLVGQNKTGWIATFDWIIANEDNSNKVMEGNYERKVNENLNKGQRGWD